MKKILLISGQIGISSSGNQTFKNTIYYLAKAKFKLNIFTFVPNDYPDLLDSNKIFAGYDNISFHCLPNLLNFLFKCGRRVKNLKRKKGSSLKINDNVEYFSDYNFSARIIYFLSWAFYIFLETPRVFMACLKEMPDLFYGYEIYGARVASILGVIFRKPVATRFQGTVLDITNKDNWKYLPHQVWGLRSPASAIIMGNDGTRGDEILLNLGVPREKIYFWMNGLDQNIFNFVCHPQAIERLKKNFNIQNKKIIISVNRLILWKRIDRMIHALYKLINDYKMDDVVLLIIGKGSERENLEKLAISYKISNSVIFLEGIPHQDIGRYFCLSDVFVIVNDISNLGNQLLEALYFGLPIITLKDESLKGILKDGYNAILVSPRRIEEGLPKAVFRVLTDGDLAKKLRYNAKITAKKKVLSWQARMQKEIDLITNLIEGKK